MDHGVVIERQRTLTRIAEELQYDVRLGIRLALRNPGFATVAILTLAVAIGGNTAIFSERLMADGSNGMPGEGTFDRIFVTAAFPSMPRFYAEQLTHGGSMIAPLMLEDGTCMMTRLTKTGSRFEREDLFIAPYLPIVPQLAAAL